MKKYIGKRHFIIPDTQIKDGVPLDHMTAAGNYVAEKRPDVIIHIGDFADMESLSSYDVGKKDYEGRTYKRDVEAAKEGMNLFLKPIKKVRNYKPRKIVTLGNHENRIDNAINIDRKLEGLISVQDLPFNDWEVHPFLAPVCVGGIMYCHYFTSGVLGRPVSSARLLNTKKHQSCVMGHVQKKEVDIQYRADGRRITSIFAGTYYQHIEKYLGPQGNQHTHQCWMFHEVHDGEYDECPVSLPYLMKEYL